MGVEGGEGLRAEEGVTGLALGEGVAPREALAQEALGVALDAAPPSREGEAAPLALWLCVEDGERLGLCDAAREAEGARLAEAPPLAVALTLALALTLRLRLPVEQAEGEKVGVPGVRVAELKAEADLVTLTVVEEEGLEEAEGEVLMVCGLARGRAPARRRARAYLSRMAGGRGYYGEGVKGGG